MPAEVSQLFCQSWGPRDQRKSKWFKGLSAKSCQGAIPEGNRLTWAQIQVQQECLKQLEPSMSPGKTDPCIDCALLYDLFLWNTLVLHKYFAVRRLTGCWMPLTLTPEEQNCRY